MPLLGDLLTWSETQALWVRDALRRIFIHGSLTRNDYDELYSLLLAAHGLGTEPRPVAVPLSEADLPAIAVPGVTCITGISNMENVNRFAAGSGIEFSPTGLTLVFGQNGAGKSGVTRVLKQVCRARSRQKVLPNAFVENFAQLVPTATIHYTYNGNEEHVAWSMGTDVPSELQAIAVLDDTCAQDYVSGEGDASFQPFGLAHLELLTKNAFLELRVRVEQASQALDCDVGPFSALARPTTEVGRLLARITSNIDIAAVSRLGSVSEAERTKHSQLCAVLAEPDADAKARVLEGFATRLEEAHRGAIRARAFVDERAITRWRELLERADAANRTRAEVEALIQGDHLPGTGGEAWRQMFEAAKQFSLHAAYISHEAPNLDFDARCVLCQNPIDEAARVRLRAFNDFILSDATQTALAANQAVDDARSAITEADLTLTIEEALQAEIAASTPELITALEEARQQFGQRRTWMLEQESTRTWRTAPKMALEPGGISFLLAVAAHVRGIAAGYRAAADLAARAALEHEKAEMEARIALAPHLAALLKVVSNLRERSALEQCAATLDTTAISRQCGILATRYITDALIAGMAIELKRLGVGRIAHSLRKRTERGRTMMLLILQGSSARPADILSEGEKRMAAIAFFLAELAQSGSRSAIIVDDPVSSLDHQFRHRVAERLVEEAIQRQVVIFTHDAVFLSAILTECQRSGLTPDVKTLGWANGAPGKVEHGLPWINQSVGERLAHLDTDCRAIKDRWGEVPDGETRREMAAIYGRVRGTLERLIRENVFNKAVRPFDDRVQIERVGAVAGFSAEEFQRIEQIYLRCNPAIDAHDSSAEGARDVPHPDELAQDIAAMRELVALADARRKAYDKLDKEAAKGAERE